ncbi:MAG: hypothetical protein IKN85_12840 [Oscillospiraceae bacterium]|nr:hypothetical protein [Oscillospiraceae bacterium]
MNTVLFFISIIVSTAVFYLSYKNVSEKNTDRFKRLLPPVLSIVPILLTILGSSNVIEPGQFSDAWAFSAFACALSSFVSFADSEKFGREQKFLLKIIAVAALLELSVFNIPSYRTWVGNYPEKEVNCSDFELRENGYLDDGAVFIERNEEFSGIISDINIPVCTVFADIAFYDEKIQHVEISLDTKDETQSQEFRNDMVKSTLVRDRYGSQFLQCDLSGKVSQVRFRLNFDYGEHVSLRKIVFNKPIPFNIQYLRFIIITVISLFIYSLTCGGVLSEKFSDRQYFCNTAALFITAGCFAVSFMIVDYHMTESTWNDQFHLEKGNQVTEELVEAFKKGHVYLDRDVEEFLTEIDNPYDENQRNEAGGSYAWDHVLYKDHYYSYYGIAPVILLFLPYNLITGYYCPDELGILIFSFMAFTGISMLFMSIIRNRFSELPAGIVIACLFILQLSSGIWYSIGRPDFYEIAIAAGLAFISWGIYFLFESGLLFGEKISLKKTALASFFLAAAVLCRPTLAVYCISAAILMMLAVPAAAGKKSKSDKLFNASSVKYILCAFGPMCLLGFGQMAYNYARFDSPFDFGIQYSLTINDFTRSEFHTKFSAIAIYNYLFNPPVFLTEYPFVKTSFQHLHRTGYFYVDVLNTLNTSGLFMLVPLTWFYIFARRAMRCFPTRRQKILNLAKIVIPCLICPFIIIASVWESGYAVRYMGDFSLEVIMGAYILMFLILRTTKNQTIKKMISSFVCFSVIWVIYVEGVQIVNQAFRYQEYIFSFPEIAYDVESLISFWK